MSVGGYYILEGHKPVPVADVIEWGYWYEKADRTVATTHIGPARVSTVFLGLDHSFGDGPPLLFETMIFGGPNHDYQRRYETWDQAVHGHEEAVKLATGGIQ